tara:strand:+ start:264 stop:2309 length:2046 start_codon:yes stop_codon:yes gene_type:complete
MAPPEKIENAIINDPEIIKSSFVSAELLKASQFQLAQAQDEADTLQRQFDERSALQEENLEKITKLNRDINSLTRLLSTNQTALERAQAEQIKGRERIKAIKTTLQELKEGSTQIPILESELKPLEDRDSKLTDIIEDLKNEIAAIQAEIKDKTTNRADLIKESNEVALQLREITTRLALAQTTLITARELFESHQATFNFQQTQINTIASVNTSDSTNLSRSITEKGVNLNTQIEARDNKLDELSDDRRDLLEVRNACESQQLSFDIASNLEQTFEQLEKRFDNDNKAFEKLIRIQVLNYKPQHGGDTIDQNSEFISNLLGGYRSFGSEIEDTWKQYKEARDRYNFMVERLRTLPLSIKTLEKNIERYRSLIDEYETRRGEVLKALKEAGPPPELIIEGEFEVVAEIPTVEGEIALEKKEIKESEEAIALRSELEKLNSILEETRVILKDTEERLKSEKDELKHLQEPEAIGEAEKEMNEKLADYNKVRTSGRTKRLSDVTLALDDIVTRKTKLIKKIDQLVIDINNMQVALIPLEDAKNFTNQVKASIDVMVSGQNAEEIQAIVEQRGKSAELKDENNQPINFTAQEANRNTLAEKHAMTVTGPLIRQQIENNPRIKRVTIPGNVSIAPEELRTLIAYGYNLSFEEKELREGDVFTPVLELTIDWSVPNEPELDDYKSS